MTYARFFSDLEKSSILHISAHWVVKFWAILIYLISTESYWHRLSRGCNIFSLRSLQNAQDSDTLPPATSGLDRRMEERTFTWLLWEQRQIFWSNNTIKKVNTILFIITFITGTNRLVKYYIRTCPVVNKRRIYQSPSKQGVETMLV